MTVKLYSRATAGGRNRDGGTILHLILLLKKDGAPALVFRRGAGQALFGRVQHVCCGVRRWTYFLYLMFVLNVLSRGFGNSPCSLM